MVKLIRLTTVAALSLAPTLAYAAQVTASDKKFLVKDAQGGAYELASANLAAEKASAASVKGYARKLVSDHEQLNAALEKLGQDEGLTLPTDMDRGDQKRLKKLRALSGPAFDKAYVKEAVRINAEDKRDADKEKKTTKVDAIKDFIQRFASMDAEHESLAKGLKASGT